MPVSEQAMATAARLPIRIRRAMRVWTNWLQFSRYAVVGVVGWGISVGVFALLVHAGGLGTTLAATGAFCVALANNFVWNRYWTFRAGDGHAGFQALRYVVINVIALLFSLGVLRVLIDLAGVPAVVAQGIAVLAAAPPNYVANRLWSFKV